MNPIKNLRAVGLVASAFIDESEFEDLIETLDPAARIPLEAHFSRFYAFRPGPKTVAKLNDPSARAAASGDGLAQAHLEFAWGNRISRLGGDNQEMESRPRAALARLLTPSDEIFLVEKGSHFRETCNRPIWTLAGSPRSGF